MNNEFFFPRFPSIPTFGSLEIIFIFVAFLVVAKLVANHFASKQKLALKRLELDKDNAAHSPVSSAKKTSGISILVTVLILFLSGFLFMAILSLFAFVSFAPSPVIVSHPPQASPSDLAAEAAFVSSPPTPNAPISNAPMLQHNAPARLDVAVLAEAPDTAQPLQRIEDWKAELFFPANQYSGAESCAIPLARRIHEELERDERPDEKNSDVSAPQTLVVNIENLKANGDAGFLDQFKTAFQKLSPNVKIVEAAAEKKLDEKSDSSENPATEYDVTVSVSTLSRYSDGFPDRTIEVENGAVACRLRRKGAEKEDRGKTFSVKFAETPWLNDFAKFARLYPSQKIFVGLSQGFEESSDNADEEARLDIANQMERSSIGYNATTYRHMFKQKITRPYGKVYRTAILAIVTGYEFAGHSESSPAYASVSRAKSFQIDPERGVAVLAIMTVMLTFIANAATQGYYRTGLSRTAVIVCSLAILFIFLIVVLNFA